MYFKNYHKREASIVKIEPTTDSSLMFSTSHEFKASQEELDEWNSFTSRFTSEEEQKKALLETQKRRKVIHLIDAIDDIHAHANGYFGKCRRDLVKEYFRHVSQ